MRSYIFPLLACAASGFGFAAEITLPLTPESLIHWQQSGDGMEPRPSEPPTLAAGAQLSRSFASESLTVGLISNPHFAIEPENWPVIELGSAVLIFARHDNIGYLVLAVGAENIAVHPSTVPLADDERSQEPIEAFLHRHGSTVSLVTADTRIELAAPGDELVTVVVAAGASHSWTLDRLAVTLAIPDEVIPADLRTGNDSPDGKADLAERIANERVAKGRYGPGSAGDNLGSVSRRPTVAASQGRPLEIYTPPSVRTHRAEQLKAAVIALRNQ